MFKIKWKITEDIKNYKVCDYGKEWISIYGGFELCINTHTEGYCPMSELMPGEEWSEDIIYMISKLVQGAVEVYYGKIYEIPMLSSNLRKIILNPQNELELKYVDSENSDKIYWSEFVAYKEFYKIVYDNAKEFLEYIKRHNEEIMLIKSLRDIKDNTEIIKMVIENTF